MNLLPDPIGGKGYANVLPPMNIPKFDNITALQSHGNDMALQYAKLAADQRAKAAALAQKQAELNAKAAEAAKKAKDKQQADTWTLLKDDTDPLIGDAQKWAADAYRGLVDEATQLQNEGIDLNSFDPKATEFRQKINQYHVNYKRHSEIAKTLIEKQKKWNESPDEYEAFALVNDIEDYNQTGWNKEYYPKSLMKKVGIATPAEVAAYEKQMLGEAASRVSQSKKPTGYDVAGNAIYSQAESYEARPFQEIADDVNKNLRHSTDTKQKQLFNFYYNQAKAQGLVDDQTDDILPQYFQKREEITREKGGVKPVTVKIAKEKEGRDNSYSWNSRYGGFQVGKNTIIQANGAYIQGGNRPLDKTPSLYRSTASTTYPKATILSASTLGDGAVYDITGGDPIQVPNNEVANIGNTSLQNIIWLPVNPQTGAPLNQHGRTEQHWNSVSMPFVAKTYEKDIEDEYGVKKKEEKKVLINLAVGAPQLLQEANLPAAQFPDENEKMQRAYEQRRSRELGANPQTPKDETPFGITPKTNAPKKKF